MSRIKLSNDWLLFLKDEMAKPYMAELGRFLGSEFNDNKIIYPVEENIFRALDLVPPEKVKVVILGQDPYHGKAEAHGLSFPYRRARGCHPLL